MSTFDDLVVSCGGILVSSIRLATRDGLIGYSGWFGCFKVIWIIQE